MTAMTTMRRYLSHACQAVLLLGLWLGLGRPAHAQTDTVYVYYTDPQGTPLAKADIHGNILARYDYTPYGSPATALGNPPNGPGYTGHVNDPESGLVYMQQRYYDPVTGRFLSPDPVTTYSNPLGAFNRYWYGNGNPIANVDPDGRSSRDDVCMGNMRCISEGGDGGGGDQTSTSSGTVATLVTHDQNNSVPVNGYLSAMDAGTAGVKAAGSLSQGQEEYLGITLKKDSRYWYTVPITLHESHGVMMHYVLPSGYSYGGVWFHTHPPGGPRDMVFSGTDVATSVALKWVAIIGFHLDGSIRYFDPATMRVGLRLLDQDKFSVYGIQAKKAAKGELLCAKCFP